VVDLRERVGVCAGGWRACEGVRGVRRGTRSSENQTLIDDAVLTDERHRMLMQMLLEEEREAHERGKQRAQQVIKTCVVPQPLLSLIK